MTTQWGEYVAVSRDVKAEHAEEVIRTRIARLDGRVIWVKRLDPDQMDDMDPLRTIREHLDLPDDMDVWAVKYETA